MPGAWEQAINGYIVMEQDMIDRAVKMATDGGFLFPLGPAAHIQFASLLFVASKFPGRT